MSNFCGLWAIFLQTSAARYARWPIQFWASQTWNGKWFCLRPARILPHSRFTTYCRTFLITDQRFLLAASTFSNACQKRWLVASPVLQDIAGGHTTYKYTLAGLWCYLAHLTHYTRSLRKFWHFTQTSSDSYFLEMHCKDWTDENAFAKQWTIATSQQCQTISTVCVYLHYRNSPCPVLDAPLNLAFNNAEGRWVDSLLCPSYLKVVAFCNKSIECKEGITMMTSRQNWPVQWISFDTTYTKP